MTEQEKNQVIQILTARQALLPCPRCGNPSFTLLDGYFAHPAHADLRQVGNVVVGGPVVPSVAATCARCGYLSFHAIGTLGMMPSQPNVPGAEAKKNG